MAGDGVPLSEHTAEVFAPREFLQVNFRAGRVADAADLRVAPAVRDQSGPLRDKPYVDEQVEALQGRVFDMCDDEEAFEAITHQPYRQGAVMPHRDYRRLHRLRPDMGCYGMSTDSDASAHRYALVGSSGELSYFGSPAEALKQFKQWRRTAEAAYANTLPRGVHALGWTQSTSGYYTEFAPLKNPINEVRVLVDSVTLHSGILRGLVRNWSRDLFAYSLTVTAHGKRWEWPLSVQPGEVAPFEIEGWDGPMDPGHIDFNVEAVMSTEIDVSRAWSFEFMPRWELLTAAQVLQQGYPPSVVDRLPPTGAFMFSHASAYWAFTDALSILSGLAQPSLAEIGGFVHIADLRGYVAFIEDVPGGGVMEVEPVSLLSVVSAVDAVVSDQRLHYVEAKRFPHIDAQSSGRWVLSPFRFLMGWRVPDVWRELVWVGGAHPQSGV
jgi:hypothetical protein